MTTTITGKNQITIPAAVAALYHLKPGTFIEWLPGTANDEIRCRIIPEPKTLARQLRGAGRKHLRKDHPHPLQRLRSERDNEAAREKAL